MTVLDTGELFRACGRAIQGLSLNTEQQALVDLVKQSVDSREAGGGQMIEVCRAILLSPTEDEFYRPRGEVTAEASASATTLLEFDPSNAWRIAHGLKGLQMSYSGGQFQEDRGASCPKRSAQAVRPE